MDRKEFFYRRFRDGMKFDLTSGQDSLLREAADFVTCDDADILVVNGYAGTGKTTVMAAVVEALRCMEIPCVLLAPTGRAAKVLSSYTHMPAYTVHKCIYRRKSTDDAGFGQFSLAPNKARDTLFIVDEVSLMGIGSADGRQTAVFGSGDLLGDLVEFVRNGRDCRMILVGDSAQLPPVGLEESPALSRDYMSQMGGVRFSVLTEVVRQQKESGILHNATRLREIISAGNGEIRRDALGLSLKPFDDVERIGGEELAECIADAYGKYGEDETIVLCRSNKRAIRYNAGIRAQVQYREERLVRGDRLMIVKNCYQFVGDVKEMDYIANGDMAVLAGISRFEERYGLHFAQATLAFPDYGGLELGAKVLLDTLESESASLDYGQSERLYRGVSEDYAHLSAKKRYEAVREDPYYNALQLKYANAITCHKSQGGQWQCVFIDNPFWQETLGTDDLKWLYTAFTRAVGKVFLVNFDDELFID